MAVSVSFNVVISIIAMRSAVKTTHRRRPAR